MIAIQLAGIGRFERREVPDPLLVRDTDVLIRIKTVGVCGSDIHYYTTGRIGSQVVEFPFVIGHEASGIVEKTGRKVSRVRPGNRIAIDPALSCGHCDQCLAGREHTCRELLFLGCPGQMSGSLCEFVVLDQKCCYPIEPEMTFEQATLAEPLAIGVYAVERSAVREGADAAVLGLGPIGMSVFHLLRTRNVGNVYATDKRDERLAFSGTLHPRWTGNPDRVDVVKEVSRIEPLLLDVVYDCSGDPEAIRQGVQLLKPGGSLVLVGIPETDEISFPIHELRRKEITVLNIRRQVHCTQKALDLLSTKQVKMDSMVTHRFPLSRTAEAFELVASYRDGVMKAMISVE